MLSVFSVVGVIGNAIAFYIFVRRRSTSTSTIFILALAGTDFFTCLVTIPFTIIFELLKYNLVYDLACKTYMFLITSTVPFSAYIMVGIALDRYFCICHPFLYVFTLPRAKTVILCMSIPAVIFGIITALSHGTYVYEWHIQSNLTSNAHFPHSTVAFNDKAEVERILALKNLTNANSRLNIAPYGQCVNNTFIFSQDFLEIYEKIHALNFILAYISVAVLYTLIYKSIFTRRVNKAKRKKSNLYPTPGNKTKENQREETQMTAINGGVLKGLNNQTRKDGKNIRKITLTARNDPTAFSKSDPQKKPLPVIPKPKVQKEDRFSFLTKSRNRGSNAANGNAQSNTKSKVSQPSCEPSTAGEYFGKEIDSCVYIGPQSNEEKNSVYIGPQSNEEKNSVYIGPQSNEEKNCVYIGPQSNEEKNCVYIGPQSNEEKNCVYIGPQSNEEKNNVYVGPQPWQDENIGPHCSEDKNNSYIDAKASQEDDSAHNFLQSSQGTNNVYVGPQSSLKENELYVGPQQSQENSSIYVGPLLLSQEEHVAYTGPQSSPYDFTSNRCFEAADEEGSDLRVGKLVQNITNEHNHEIRNMLDISAKLSNDKYEIPDNNDDGANNAVSCSPHGTAPEETPLLPHPQPFPAASPDSLALQPTSSKRDLSQTQETALAAEETGKIHPQTKVTHVDTQPTSLQRKRPGTVRDRHFMANIKTAFMLFIVTLVFIIAFLPALLMANDLIPLNLIIFYGYFIYNVVNPFIYAFMNQTFREDLKKLMTPCQR